jgi:hypothetical protein
MENHRRQIQVCGEPAFSRWFSIFTDNLFYLGKFRFRVTLLPRCDWFIGACFFYSQDKAGNFFWRCERMKVILFSLYYSGLLFRVMLGIHRTINPLGLGWRWNNWRYRYARSRGRHF